MGYTLSRILISLVNFGISREHLAKMDYNCNISSCMKSSMEIILVKTLQTSNFGHLVSSHSYEAISKQIRFHIMNYFHI